MSSVSLIGKTFLSIFRRIIEIRAKYQSRKSVPKKADSDLDFPNEFSTFFRILRKRLDFAVTKLYMSGIVDDDPAGQLEAWVIFKYINPHPNTKQKTTKNSYKTQNNKRYQPTNSFRHVRDTIKLLLLARDSTLPVSRKNSKIIVDV